MSLKLKQKIEVLNFKLFKKTSFLIIFLNSSDCPT